MMGLGQLGIKNSRSLGFYHLFFSFFISVSTIYSVCPLVVFMSLKGINNLQG